MIGTTYIRELQCEFHGWRVLGEGVIALDIPEYQCCSMSGALEIAEKIMPGVKRIASFAGGVPDTEYRLSNGKWVAYDMRPSVRVASNSAFADRGETTTRAS